VSLKPGSEIPQSELLAHKARRSLASIASITIIIAGIALMWFEPWVIREEPASLERMAFPLPDKPSIAVLPFDNMSGDPEQEYFVDGLTEDLITDLSKLDGLFVIARNSVFSYKGRSVKVNQVAEELGVRYVLEGSVRRVADQVRINAQLIDTTTGGHIWADRYDGALENVFDLQDQIAARILSALQLRLTGTGQESKGQHYKKQLDAYDSLLKGLAVGGQRSREANLEARGFFLEAIEFDPGFARAYSALANTYRIAHRNGWSNLPERSLDTAYDLVVKALELEETLPQVHFVKSLVHRERKELKLAIASAERAIDLDPNYADALVALASILCYGGKSAEGLALMERAKRLNPHYPSHYPFHEGQCYFVKANYAEAINAFDRAAEQTPDSQRVHVWLAASHILSGNQDEAEWEADNVKVLNPGFSVQEMKYVVPLKDPKHLEAFIKALEKAGLPE
jgi:adenylate cyclase